MNIPLLEQLKKHGEKIAMELVFAESGKDSGLLPINSLLGQIEETLAAATWPEALIRAADEARRCVDSILELRGSFDSESLRWLGQWATWWSTAMNACQNEAAPAPFTDVWSIGATQAVNAKPMVDASAAVAGELPLALNLPEDADLLREFLNEGQEHLQNIEQGVLVLERDPGDADTLNAIFRAFHTFKGNAGFLNLAVIQNLAHQLESLLDLARQHKLEVTAEVISLILEGGDTLKQFTREIGASLTGERAPGPIQVPTVRLLNRIAATLDQKTESVSQPPKTASEPVTTDVSPVEERSMAPNLDSRPGSKSRIETTSISTAGRATVKVDTHKLDNLMDLVGEMVIAQALVIQNPDLNAIRSEQLTRSMAQLGRITKDLQRTAMALRMVPIRATFQKMHRVVRDVSAKLTKQVQLVTEGEDTELDRTIVEEICDPLIHMIRNSVDHGVEKPEVREACGKPAQGTVWLKAFHQGGNLVIEIKDDGKGLDRDRILAKAIQKGLAEADEQLCDNEIYNFILAPGFSTAEEVTDLSGRGVGMDVVRRNVEKLRGKIEIQSRAGQGSSFRIYLPLTLAIIDGLLVGVGKHCYILPTLLVRESFRPATGMISKVQGRGEVVNVRGRLQPLLRLYAHLGIEPATTDPMQSMIIVVESGSATRCLLVDKLIGKQEVVIKALGFTFQSSRYLAGATVLGDGGVGLILDPHALVHLENVPLRKAA